MGREETDAARDHRIRDEVIVDAYTPDEQSLGWYYYLSDKLDFPFEARCSKDRAISPLQVGEQVRVVGIPSEAVCRFEMFVDIDWMNREFSVPLIQLEPVDATSDTEEAIADWHYWFTHREKLA